MKKTYKKPVAIIENFSLSTNVAGDCHVDITNATYNTCAYEDPRDPAHPIFTDLISACETTEADGESNGICYHVPTESGVLFNS